MDPATIACTACMVQVSDLLVELGHAYDNYKSTAPLAARIQFLNELLKILIEKLLQRNLGPHTSKRVIDKAQRIQAWAQEVDQAAKEWGVRQEASWRRFQNLYCTHLVEAAIYRQELRAAAANRDLIIFMKGTKFIDKDEAMQLSEREQRSAEVPPGVMDAMHAELREALPDLVMAIAVGVPMDDDVLTTIREVFERRHLDYNHEVSHARTMKLQRDTQLIQQSHFDWNRPPCSEGGFSQVYKQEWGGREVGVKMFHEVASDQREEQERAIRDEALTINLLQHPNIVRLLGVVMDGDRCRGLVLEWCGGGTLCNPANKGQVVTPREKERKKLLMALQVAKAMDYMHGKGVTHGDLKPGNVLLTETNRCVVTDFGLARYKLFGQKTECVSPSHSLTLQYAAPEQLNGEPARMPADVYAFGILLLELMTGQRPWAGVPAELVGIIVQSGKRPEVNGCISAGLVKLIKQCWAHAPSQRPRFPAVVSQLEKELQLLLSPSTPVERAPGHKRRAFLSMLRTVLRMPPLEPVSPTDEDDDSPPLSATAAAAAGKPPGTRSMYSLQSPTSLTMARRTPLTTQQSLPNAWSGGRRSSSGAGVAGELSLPAGMPSPNLAPAGASDSSPPAAALASMPLEAPAYRARAQAPETATGACPCGEELHCQGHGVATPQPDGASQGALPGQARSWYKRSL